MNRYGQYCPLARAAEILGDRWTLLIVRDLLCGTHHFNALERGLPGISRALLAERLSRLQQMGLLEREVEPGRRRTRYELTAAGQELKSVIEVMMQWGARWAFGEPEANELDPVLLMWWMRDRVCPEEVPQKRTVVEFSFRGMRKQKFWLVLKDGDVSVCLRHPGFEPDVRVEADLSTLLQVWLGRIRFEEAIRDRRIELDGMLDLVRAFPRWFALSRAAGTVRAAESRRTRR
jgi:DNA-binding HxlR family transcriptional regulator